ncbi:MAG TPA: endonuclease VIII [Gammaproteobacteria bacterium]|nr:endonuclease VIII [Gammaproteobacteria bacterium]
MPEGPEIRRAADRVAECIAGQVAETVWFAFEHLKPFERQLSGVQVRAVEARGKAMLTRFANGLVIYSHNQLYGRWYCCPAGERPDIKRQLRLAIHNRKSSALLYSASDIEVLREDELASHPFLSRLGPDVLDPATGRALLLKRLNDRRFRSRRLGSLLTDQGFVAGLGNYLRCEILFVAGLHPCLRSVQLTDAQRLKLVDAMLQLPRQSYETGGITNDLARARELMASGADFETARFRVFRREGLPCYRCGAPITKQVLNGQPTYLCLLCQRMER